MEVTNLKSINEVVAEQIKNSGPTVTSIVVDRLANVEIERRTNAVIAGMAALDKLRKEASKLKPDNVTFQVIDGVKTEIATWTKAGIEAKEKSDAKVEKLAKAIDTALEKNDNDSYNKLIEASK